MEYTLVFVVLILINSSLLTQGSYIQPRVVGGRPSNTSESPFFTWMEEASGKLFCGGTLISPIFVLTGAHCFDDSDDILILSYIQVCAGSTVKSDRKRRVCRTIASFVLHESYNYDTVNNDIAIVKVSQPFPLSSKIHPIKLSSNPIESGHLCRTMGYGLTNPDDNRSSNVLMTVELPIVSRTVCALEYLFQDIKITSNMICAGYQLGGKDTCSGDSGGPLICDNKLTGVVSFGLSCADWFRPGVYTEVSKYIPWIMSNCQLMDKRYMPQHDLIDNSNRGNQIKKNKISMILLLIIIFLNK